ncbi:hypothetical protein [Planococcus versutus]|uniref:Uncharacterized protein n=1 Tax=Planococcus versutus TaxID=1302659 RepID=A0A1B1S5V6_9BACL|nr:hypothetical protein [Planococcus versutus]ANU28564.1 hypothetical protein I858_016410 [Planococcus versutus]
MKNSSSLIIGLAIIIGFAILGFSLVTALGEKESEAINTNAEHRYELIPANENNLIIFDKESGQYWNKFISVDEGPTTWEKGDSPIKNNE